MKKIYYIKPKTMLILAFILCMIITLILLPCLPDDLPMQFGNDGAINWTLPKYLGVLLIPAIAALLSAYYMKSNSLEYQRVLTIILLLVINLGFLSFVAFF